MDWVTAGWKLVTGLFQIFSRRRRLHVRIIKELAPQTSGVVVLKFEAENRSEKPDSFTYTVALTGLSPFRHDPCNYVLEVQEQDRSLSPFVPKIFRATVLADEDLSFLWFNKYVFRTSGGARFVVLTEGASWPKPIEVPLGRFYLWRFLMRRCGLLVQPSKANSLSKIIQELKTSKLKRPRS